MIDIVAVIAGKTLYACKHCRSHLFWSDEEPCMEWNFCPFCGWPINDEELE